jgi:hypothetical protein
LREQRPNYILPRFFSVPDLRCGAAVPLLIPPGRERVTGSTAERREMKQIRLGRRLILA